jgi:heme A synthase
LAGIVVGLTGAQLAIGAVNLILLAPVWMQILHLLAADAVWIAFVFLSAELLHPSLSSNRSNNMLATARS